MYISNSPERKKTSRGGGVGGGSSSRFDWGFWIWFSLDQVCELKELKGRFSRLPHGEATTFWKKIDLARRLSIIDLSTDFQK